jgi:ppGpp synthetase/RelA/SpoT-type nucleotidyltranferase
MERQEIINKYISLRPVYKKLAEKVALIIEELLELNIVNYHVVSYRAKTVDSFSDKIKKPKYKNPLIELTDLAGIRIIGYVEDDIKQISKIIEEVFDIDPDKSLDKSQELGVDKVGYKSVHYVCYLPQSRTDLPEYSRFLGLSFEIQVRTILQHSWAEIEHDKNYKFSGELPPEIQRRFKLVAGNLELADREFNQLSREIDEYGKSIKESTKKGKLDIELNSTALKEFLNTKFRGFIEKGLLTPNFNGSKNENIILNELRDFGIFKLSDLNKIISPKLIEAYEKGNYSGNFLGFTRLIMMAYDANGYMTKSFKNHWSGLAHGQDLILESLGVDLSLIEKHLEKE